MYVMPVNLYPPWTKKYLHPPFLGTQIVLWLLKIGILSFHTNFNLDWGKYNSLRETGCGVGQNDLDFHPKR